MARARIIKLTTVAVVGKAHPASTSWWMRHMGVGPGTNWAAQTTGAASTPQAVLLGFVG